MLAHHDKNPHHTFMYVWIVGALAVLFAGMIGYSLQHPRTVLAPAVETVGTTTPSVPTVPADTTVVP